MAQIKEVCRKLLLIIIGGAYLFTTPSSATAQIKPDRTLPNNSNVTINGSIFNITGGTQAGRNLFHSFEQFSVPTGSTAFFNNAVEIQNIISRVTGGSISNIDGSIAASGKANLFLINPSGIVFGTNASLNVGGSFLATTANALQFGNLGSFSASNPQTPSPLLTINPTALLFNQSSIAQITNRSTAPAGVNPFGNNTTGLRVPDGDSLLLVGGNVNLDGGNLKAFGGRVELAGLAAPGSVGLNIAGNTFSLSVPSDVPRADVSLTNQAAIIVYGTGGGDIAINARNLELSNSYLFDGSVGNGGNIQITTGSLSVTNGAQVATDTSGRGNAGNITINARDSVTVNGVSKSNTAPSLVTSTLTPNGVGNGGNIQINARALFLTGGGEVDAFGIGLGNNAGSITINASDTVAIDGVGTNGFQSGALTDGYANAGDIQLTTGTLSLTNGGELARFSPGNAGNITVNARDAITIDGAGRSGGFTGISSSLLDGGVGGKGGDIRLVTNSLTLSNSAALTSFTSGQGNAGNINLTTGSFSLNNGSLLLESTSGRGNAGNITIDARDTIQFNGIGNTQKPTGAFSTVETGAVGNAGNISVTTGSFSLNNGSQLLSSISGRGNAGKINVTAGTLYEVNNAQVFTSSLGVGNAGDINITTKDGISLDSGSTVSSTLGVSTAPRISISLNNNNLPILTLEPLAQTVSPNAQGNSGNINISTSRLSVTNGAQLTTNTSGRGNAGNINLNTNTAIFAGFNPNGSPSGASSSVEPSAVGNGGVININTDELTLFKGGQLVASSFGRGNAGSVNIAAGDTVSLNGVSTDGNPSGAFSAVETGAIGNGGNLRINAKRLNILNGAAADVSNLGSSNLNAGNLQLTADSINLDFGRLIANSTSGQGGNINLQASNILLLRHNSLISNTSGTSLSGGSEGSFTLNTKFLVAPGLNNSDIVTNAFNGRGGQIDITASDGVFGFVVRTQQDLERLLGTTDPNQLDPQKLPTNDISSISQNTPTIISPDIDPARGLIILPAITENPPKLVSSNCTAFNETAGGSNFTITGRGGLPASPYEPLNSDAIWSDTRIPLTTAQQKQPKKHAAKPQLQPIAIVPATGWVFNRKGEVTLISSVSNTTSSSTPMSCPAK